MLAKREEIPRSFMDDSEALAAQKITTHTHTHTHRHKTGENASMTIHHVLGGDIMLYYERSSTAAGGRHQAFVRDVHA